MNLSVLLMALAGPLAKQVIGALGFGIVTFLGVDLALTALLDQARMAWAGQTSAAVASYLAMAGVNTGLSIIAGAMVARVAMVATKSMRLL